MKRYTSALSLLLRVLFCGFLSRLLNFLGGGLGWEWGLSQKPPLSPFLNCVSAVIIIIAKVAPLPFTVSGNMDHG